MAFATRRTLEYGAVITAIIQSSSIRDETPASAEGPAMTAAQAEGDEEQARPH